jgi:hypothetical protein
LGERLFLSIQFIKRLGEKLPEWLIAFLGIVYTYSVFSFTFFLFRAKPLVFPETNFTASPLDVGWYMILRALIPSEGKIVIPSLQYFVLIFALFIVEYWMEYEDKKIYIKNFIKSDYLYIVAGVILFTCLTIYSVTVSQPFVYFQF